MFDKSHWQSPICQHNTLSVCLVDFDNDLSWAKKKKKKKKRKRKREAMKKTFSHWQRASVNINQFQQTVDVSIPKIQTNNEKKLYWNELPSHHHHYHQFVLIIIWSMKKQWIRFVWMRTIFWLLGRTLIHRTNCRWTRTNRDNRFIRANFSTCSRNTIESIVSYLEKKAKKPAQTIDEFKYSSSSTTTFNQQIHWSFQTKFRYEKTWYRQIDWIWNTRIVGKTFDRSFVFSSLFSSIH